MKLTEEEKIYIVISAFIFSVILWDTYTNLPKIREYEIVKQLFPASNVELKVKGGLLKKCEYEGVEYICY